MRKVHVHEGGFDGIICDADDCSYVKRAKARKRRAHRLAFTTCVIAAAMSAVAIASEHRYGWVFLALFLIVVPIICDEVLTDRSRPV